MIIYHGSNCDFNDIDLSKSKDKRDFGKGFYLTTDWQQAEDWARKLFRRYGGAGIFVYEYTFEPNLYLSNKHFGDIANEEWLTMIKENRKNGGIQHNFDVVQGKVADWLAAAVISDFIDGIYTIPETIIRLKTENLIDQLSFHTSKAIKCLTLNKKHVLK